MRRRARRAWRAATSCSPTTGRRPLTRRRRRRGRAARRAGRRPRVPAAALPRAASPRPSRTTTAPPGGSARGRRARSIRARRCPAVAAFAEGERWEPQRDLLNSDRFAAELRASRCEEDGCAHLRFGDGVLGRRADARTSAFSATYRVGTGRAGNVGAGVLDADRHRRSTVDAASWNPLPATGGVDPRAARAGPPVRAAGVPHAGAGGHRRRLRGVRRAPPRGPEGRRDPALDGQLVHDLHHRRPRRRPPDRRRVRGRAARVPGPVPARRPRPRDRRAALRAARARAHGLRRAGLRARRRASAALLEAFEQPRRPRGFFHPDNFTFGQPVYLSAIVAAAMGVAGVEWVEVDRHSTAAGEPAAGELEAGAARRRPARDRAAGQRPEPARERPAGLRPEGRTVTDGRDDTCACGCRPAAAEAAGGLQPPRARRARLPDRHARQLPAPDAAADRRVDAAGGPGEAAAGAAHHRARADDPAIALLDAWATVGDVLTFYQERIANEGFLRTATERRSVLELARHDRLRAQPRRGGQHPPRVRGRAPLRGRRPHAAGMGPPPRETLVARGTKVMSVPGQDELPQTFETREDLIARQRLEHDAPAADGSAAGRPRVESALHRGHRDRVRARRPCADHGRPALRSGRMQRRRSQPARGQKLCSPRSSTTARGSTSQVLPKFPPKALPPAPTPNPPDKTPDFTAAGRAGIPPVKPADLTAAGIRMRPSSSDAGGDRRAHPAASSWTEAQLHVQLAFMWWNPDVVKKYWDHVRRGPDLSPVFEYKQIAPAMDVTRPKVVKVSSRRTQEKQHPNPRIVVAFSEPMNAATAIGRRDAARREHGSPTTDVSRSRRRRATTRHRLGRDRPGHDPASRDRDAEPCPRSRARPTRSSSRRPRSTRTGSRSTAEFESSFTVVDYRAPRSVPPEREPVSPARPTYPTTGRTVRVTFNEAAQAGEGDGEQRHSCATPRGRSSPRDVRARPTTTRPVTLDAAGPARPVDAVHGDAHRGHRPIHAGNAIALVEWEFTHAAARARHPRGRRGQDQGLPASASRPASSATTRRGGRRSPSPTTAPAARRAIRRSTPGTTRSARSGSTRRGRRWAATPSISIARCRASSRRAG